ncbi:Polyadenylate-binding protein, cytoplasmic and nuclear [Smittium culicis]|uniref:Polyadenylate-binding protein n=1 Tax=Smittium culicis TaxID=133412 RepID=A0A1R1XWW3_9FUNG|nr:Polyadenylate-binding protein, cytoplasmic and nuclear [Smittium culicis]OMJ19150.1 Polyadenylate-binding protein, cytoplasmic and nuclear [Smittium culicis]
MSETIPAAETVEAVPQGLNLNGEEQAPQPTAEIATPAEGFVAAAPAVPFASASLYVGELDENVTEAVLFELFSIIGSVASIRVCRDALTRRSLGYAYVNYHNREEGQRALETLNYTEIKGRPCRIMWSQRDPSIRKGGQGNIFIKNLDESIDNKALHDTFTAFGNILSCKVAVDSEGKSRGYGFVHYETNEAAELAIENVNGMLLNEKQVYVGYHISRRERMSKVEERRSKFTNVYVKNLDESVTDDDFKKIFEAYGEISSAVVSRDESGQSKGFGFVDFVDHECAAKAVESLHDSLHFGKNLFVSRAQKKNERSEELRQQFEQLKIEKLNKYQGVNLYIKNFDDDVDDIKLRQEFSVYGVITSTKVMRDAQGKSRGFGFVCFSSPDEAIKSVTEMNGRMWGSKPIYVALAQRKDQRRSQLEAMSRQIRIGGQMNNVGPNIYNNNSIYFPSNQGYPVQRGVGFNPNGIQRPIRWNGAQPGPQQNFPNANAVPNQYNAQNTYPVNNQRPQRGRNPRSVSRGGFQGPANANRNGAANRAGNRNPRNQQSQDSKSAAPESADGSAAGNAADQESGEPTALSAAYLAAADPESQKAILGESLFPLIEALQGDLAGKITGMILEIDNSELLYLLENNAALEAKVNEAVDVLNKSNQTAEEA